jgi:hypothetical protein
MTTVLIISSLVVCRSASITTNDINPIDYSGEKAKDVSRFRSHGFSINRLKLCRYLSTRRETAPPKLEVSLKVTHVVRSGRDTKDTTPAARWSGA